MSNKIKFINFGTPQISNKEINSVNKVLQSKWIGTGFVTKNFESKFRKYKKIKYSLSVNSCTAALHLSLIALKLKKGDEIITTPLTFCSTLNVIELVGAKPVLCDINVETLNIDPDKIKKKITKKTKAIIVVNFKEIHNNIDKICKIANKYKLHLIEDCAHAIESKYKNQPTGTFGITGCFSFYANKNLTTGEGGMLITNFKKIANRINYLRLHGMSKDAWKRHLPNTLNQKEFEHYDVVEPGLKYNMIDINAAIGIEQLKKINVFWQKRKKLHNFYKKKLLGLPIKFQNITNYRCTHGYHLFVIIIDTAKSKKKRDNLIKYLRKNNIAVAVNYRCITDMSFYKKKYKWSKYTVPIAKNIGDNIISLPFYPSLKISDAKIIVDKIRKYFD